MDLVQRDPVALLQHHQHAGAGARLQGLPRSHMLADQITRMLERRVGAHEDVALHVLAVEEDR